MAAVYPVPVPLFMLSRDESTARNVEAVMKEVYTRIGIDFLYVCDDD